MAALKIHGNNWRYHGSLENPRQLYNCPRQQLKISRRKWFSLILVTRLILLLTIQNGGERRRKRVVSFYFIVLCLWFCYSIKVISLFVNYDSSLAKICLNFIKICLNFIKICLNFIKIRLNFIKICLNFIEICLNLRTHVHDT
jgi:hypothetical protein